MHRARCCFVPSFRSILLPLLLPFLVLLFICLDVNGTFDCTFDCSGIIFRSMNTLGNFLFLLFSDNERFLELKEDIRRGWEW